MPHTNPPSAVPLLDDNTAIDHFIARRVPSWLRSASPQDIDKLRDSLAAHQVQQARGTRLLQNIQPIEAFAIEHLRDALKDLQDGGLDVTQALWRDIRLRVEYSPFRVTDVDIPSFRLYPRDNSLLQRMLLNFSEGQAEAGFYYPGSGVVQDGTLLELAPEQLAGIGRRINLGARYQVHLDTVLQPEDQQARAEVLRLLAEDKRCTLRAHVYRSSLRGEIDLDALHMFEDILNGHNSPAFVQMPLRCRSLETLGFAVPEALIFEARGEPLPGAIRWYDHGLTRQVILYIANDPKRALRQHASWYLLGSELAEDLKDPAYRDFFTRLLHQDDRMGFLRRLMPRLEHARPELELVGLASEEVTFGTLVQKQIERIKSDAAALIVPTEATDQAVHKQRIQTLESAGLLVVGAVASFIPGVGELMLANLAWGMLNEVYEGAQEWSHGHREEALNHLLGVAGNLAIGALVAGGTALVVRQLRRSTFVDGLRPVVRDDGSERLWNSDLSVYRSALPALRTVGDDGLVHVQGRQWWQQGERAYEVRREPLGGRWRILHPTRPGSYSPRLCGNGDGAWWIQGDHPLQWRDLLPLLRHFGPRADALSDEARNLAVGIAGYDENAMRALLVERRPAPPALAQALDHGVLDAAIDRFFEQLSTATSTQGLDPLMCGYLRSLPEAQVQPRSAELALWQARAASLRYALFEHAAALREPALERAAMVLRQGFPGLPGRTAQVLVDEAKAAHRAILERGGRIPLELCEEAQACVREARVASAVEGLCLNNAYRVDTVRLVFALLRRMPEWPTGLNFELRESSLSSPLRERLLGVSETRETKVLVFDQGQFEVFDGEGADRSLALAPAASLYQSILSGLGPQRCQALGWAGDAAADLLRQTLRDAALRDRQQLASLLGVIHRPPSFRPLQRDGGGRPGYLLSGRGRLGQMSLSSMVRMLFPGFADEEVSAFLLQVQGSSDDPMGVLLRYESSLRSLEQTMNRWQQQATPFHLTSRRRVSEEIYRCWRRQTSQIFGPDGRVLGYRLSLGHVSIGDLPEMPEDVDFSHVVDLSLHEAGQTQRVDGFLRRFSGLRWLDLSDNGCTDIPASLVGMPHLRELMLNGNQVRLSDSGAQTLSSLSLLEILSLDGNPLGRSPDLRPLNHLRRLSLRRTGLVVLPEGLLTRPFLEMADLRGNALESLPDAFFSASARQREAMVLDGNPFAHDVRLRLRELNDEVPAVNEPQGSAGNNAQTRRRWLEGAEGEVLSNRLDQWASLNDEPGSAAFFNLLDSLLGTAEFRLAAGDLRTRVWRMMQGAVENTELREDLFQLAASPVTCVDSAVSSFSVLEVRFLLFQVRLRTPAAQQGTALLRFARRLFRLDRLEQFARQDITAREAEGRGVDEVEVSLAYRTHLARELDLPGQSSYMDFRGIAGVSSQDMRDAVLAVRAAEAGDELEPYIASQEFWRAWLREHHADAFSELEEDFWRQLDGLVTRQASMPEGEYLEQVNRLASQREAALDSLAQRLTRDVLASTPPS